MLKPADVRNYLDLRMRLSRTGDGRLMALMNAPLGEVQGELRIHLSQGEVQQALASAYQGSGTYVKRSAIGETLDPVRDVGRQLYSALFEGRRETLYRRSLGAAEGEGRGLRVRLELDDPEVAVLPWEFLHDGRDFVGLSNWSPVLRSHPMRMPPPAAPLSRLRVRILTADVTGRWGEVDGEIDRIGALGQRTSRLAVEVIRDVTWEGLRAAVADTEFEVLHFIGTGAEAQDGSQVLALLDPEGNGSREAFSTRPFQLVRSAGVSRVLGGNRHLRLIVLSGWETDRIAAELANPGTWAGAVDRGERNLAIVGMRGKITDRSCVAFTEGLYRGVVAGRPLEAAVTQGRQEIDLQSPGSREWGLPVFYLQAAEGVLLAELSEAAGPAVVEEGLGLETLATPPPDPNRQREWKKLRLLLGVRERNLRALEEQEAAYRGPAPELLRTQISETKSEIGRLEEELEALQSDAS